MKRIIVVSLPLILLQMACKNAARQIVDVRFADSLIVHYRPSPRALTADSDLVFWERRMKDKPDNYVNGPEYASALSSSFHLYGRIPDLLKADSLMIRSNEANQGKEPGIFRTLAALAITRHRFYEADSFVKKAIFLEGHSFPNEVMGFDISFEAGDYNRAKGLLQSLASGNSYAYLFRRSKYEHYTGSLDSAICCMLQAVDKAGSNKYLQQAALSNAADLCIHKGDLWSASGLYMKSIRMDAADFHSLLGLGWIALLHDKNDSLAERIFHFVRQHTQSPDAVLKLEQLAEAREDSTSQKRFAGEFVRQVSDSSYGQMYNKYLIELYTGILNDPARAVELALRETANRSTPQVYAWYAWSLFCDHQADKAYRIFKGYVSGKPLEGLELYYMAKMMKGLQKGYNAQQFYKAAYKNRYDLSPSKIRNINTNLE